ncbi:MAG: cytochrome c oxidase subunit II [Magnetococcales bacterium]|nr:cytochrome c oxidase subunit II [Magnetococcales bacterium]PPR17614.1 MAG: cytochrome c oxidase subunit 2 [Pseudomonadota bacterium]|tara:strand:+ start:2532 stop:3362 length:831 start_codon:yes stop_codon:yes gene_type:complete
MLKKLTALALVVLTLTTAAAFAGTVHPGGFNNPTGPIADKVNDIYNFMFWITAIIFIGVQAVIVYAIFKFRRKKNPKAAKFTHNTPLEIFWLTVPAIICAIIAWKSFDGMRFIRSMPEAGLDVEVIAYQFGWDFDYPDLEISAPELDLEVAKKTKPWLKDLTQFNDSFSVKELVVPVNTNVRVHVTSRDVIHAFYVPELIVKIDAMPGRINYQWFNIPKEGTYIGQCAELCGAAHGFMYFAIHAVSQEDYVKWVNKQRSEEGLEPMTMAQLKELTM